MNKLNFNERNPYQGKILIKVMALNTVLEEAYNAGIEDLTVSIVKNYSAETKCPRVRFDMMMPPPDVVEKLKEEFNSQFTVDNNQ